MAVTAISRTTKTLNVAYPFAFEDYLPSPGAGGDGRTSRRRSALGSSSDQKQECNSMPQLDTSDIAFVGEGTVLRKKEGGDDNR
jgi:hypothetical protein